MKRHFVCLNAHTYYVKKSRNNDVNIKIYTMKYINMMNILHNIFVNADIEDIEKQACYLSKTFFDSHEIA